MAKIGVYGKNSRTHRTECEIVKNKQDLKHMYHHTNSLEVCFGGENYPRVLKDGVPLNALKYKLLNY